MASPAISVIIPLYNAEKYLSDCLDSLLAQTFQDFELIIVDDCSTDNSLDIVNRYAPKFDGRFTLTKTEKNSGNAGYTARNKGFLFSRGEYVFFMDADDMIIETALEELYKAAKNYDADVVYTGVRYLYKSDDRVEVMPDAIGLIANQQGIEDKPTLTINDPHRNLQELLMNNAFHRTPWTKFVQRNFLADNEITFYEILSGGDYVWTIDLLCCAKRFLRIPKALYIWRDDSVDSMTRKKRPVDKQISTWCKAFVYFARALVALSSKREALKENPLYCSFALKRWLEFCLGRNFEARLQVDSDDVYEALRCELVDTKEPDLIIPFLFSIIDAQQKHLIINQQQFNPVDKQTQAHIAEFEKREQENKAYIAELEKFIFDSQRHITELENEVKRLKG